jgi:branched-chain amino acid transport system ATP-binding protein
VENIHTYYGPSYILHGISLNVQEKEVVSLLGRNGAGKTTTIRSIMGLAPPREGRIIFHEIEIAGKPPHEIFRCGIKLVPQGKQILPTLTVEENLKLAMLKTEIEGSQKKELERVYEKFPILKERRKQPGGYLSGGERQMLAIARVLIGKKWHWRLLSDITSSTKARSNSRVPRNNSEITKASWKRISVLQPDQ